ncbi:hypothetical protein [Vibrio phage CKB-S2]|nr:hypothetical protein [Vibrio phage CKB-S2]
MSTEYENLTEFQKKFWRVVNGRCHWCNNSQFLQATYKGPEPIDCPKCGANPSQHKEALVKHDDK